MRKQVVEFICDNCAATDITKDSDLPFHWVEVQYTLHYGSIEKVELCDDCREAFEKALAIRRTE